MSISNKIKNSPYCVVKNFTTYESLKIMKSKNYLDYVQYE
jgi:hypothetical protein